MTTTRSSPVNAAPDDRLIVPIGDGEMILRQAGREISILVAREEITITHARYAPDQQVAGPHVHRDHTDGFYVLEGELAFEIGREAETIRAGAGGLVAAPPGVAHSFRTTGDRPARWLTIHASDGGFAAFMRGLRDGDRVEWDIAPVPADGGLPVSEATVSHAGSGEREQSADRLGGLRCELPDLGVAEWHLAGPDRGLSLLEHGHRHRADTWLVVEGALEVALAGTRRTVDPGTLVTLPPGARYTLSRHGPEPARLLGFHTPGHDLAEHSGRDTDRAVR